MEEVIRFFIYVHAAFGGIGLLTGFLSLIAKKGSPNHKKLGKLFSISMVSSSGISLPIACMPNHENTFLFLIGLFTIYLVLSGNNALKFKNKTKASLYDKIVSGSMLVFSIVMISIGFFQFVKHGSLAILYFVFGGLGFWLSYGDFNFFKTFKDKKNAWLANHIGKMVGAFIASFTAFVVAGIKINTLAAWLLPGFIGTFYIIYWTRKVTKPKKKNII